jgi:hypothetical protein
MKKVYLFLILWLFASIADLSAQTYEWQWAATSVQPDNAGSDAHITAIATDAQGNIYAAGQFSADSVSFGSYTLYNTDPTENSNDIFLVKYDPAGGVLWATSAHGAANEGLNAVTTDNLGNVYVVGYFYSDSVLFGSHTLYNYGPTDTTDDIFIAKYSTAGAALWAESFGGDYYDGAQGVATDASGNVYLGGFFRSDSIAFGSHILHDETGLQYDNAFLAKCNSSGTLLWVVSSATLDNTIEVLGVSTDPSGNVFTTGRFTGSMAGFGNQTIHNQQVGYDDIFLAKYDSLGNALWAEDAGGSYDDIAYAVATDAQGNSYITGYMNSGTASFGAVQLENDTTDETGDIFIAKYSPGGNMLWAENFGGDTYDVGWALTTDMAGNVYVAGYYYSPQIIFGADTISNYDNTGATNDAFVAKFDQNGNPLLAIDAGGDYYDAGLGIATDQSENIYVGGFFRSDDIVFGTTTLVNNTSVNNSNPFLALYQNISAGINTPVQLPSLSLYPNPANDRIVAQSPSFTSSKVSAAVYDVAGHVVPLDQSASADRITFNTSALAAGMYIIKFTIDGEETRAKFVKPAAGQ